MRRDRRWLCVAPLYAFTLVFVLGPMLYLVALSGNLVALSKNFGFLLVETDVLLRKFSVRFSLDIQHSNNVKHQ